MRINPCGQREQGYSVKGGRRILILRSLRIRLQPIQTVAELQVRIIVPIETTITLYKRISLKAKGLKTPGMNLETLAKVLKINIKLPNGPTF